MIIITLLQTRHEIGGLISMQSIHDLSLGSDLNSKWDQRQGEKSIKINSVQSVNYLSLGSDLIHSKWDQRQGEKIYQVFKNKGSTKCKQARVN